VNASLRLPHHRGRGVDHRHRRPAGGGEFARKLAHIARWHAMSLYGQTGTGRHLNHYSHTLGEDVGT
jgi:hypothetical protein